MYNIRLCHFQACRAAMGMSKTNYAYRLSIPKNLPRKFEVRIRLVLLENCNNNKDSICIDRTPSGEV